MKLLFSLLLLPLISFGQVDWSQVTSLKIGDDEVTSISINNTIIWKSEGEIPFQYPYVTNGLICWYDGIWNESIGTHNGSAATWVNIANPGSYDLTLQRSANGWNEDSLKTKKLTGGEASTISAATSTGVPSSIITVEMVYQVDSPQNSNGETIIASFNSWKTISNVAGGTSGERLIYSGRSSNSYRVQHSLNQGTARVGALNQFSCGYGSAMSSVDGWQVYIRGVLTEVITASGQLSVPSQTGMSFFGRFHATSPDNATGKICCIRIYNRQLTEAEVLANYAADQLRFGVQN